MNCELGNWELHAQTKPKLGIHTLWELTPLERVWELTLEWLGELTLEE
jgi:hypothetical protein